MKYQKTSFSGAGIVVFFLWALLITATFGAWLQHVVTSISNEAYILLVAGAIMFPIGIIHGWGIWFGWWS